MSKVKASLILLVILATLGGIIYFVLDRQSRTSEINLSSAVATSGSSQSSGLSIEQPTNPLDLGQIPLSGINGANNSDESASKASGLDPSKFSEYDKYKSSQSALFGEIIKGSGTEVSANKKVVIVYRTWLTDGTLIDESKKDKDNKTIPIEFTFGSNQVIPGLQQGMAGMRVGSTRLIIIPPSVGYGDQTHENVPPNSVLVFETSLIKVGD